VSKCLLNNHSCRARSSSRITITSEASEEQEEGGGGGEEAQAKSAQIAMPNCRPIN